MRASLEVKTRGRASLEKWVKAQGTPSVSPCSPTAAPFSFPAQEAAQGAAEALRSLAASWNHSPTQPHPLEGRSVSRESSVSAEQGVQDPTPGHGRGLARGRRPAQLSGARKLGAGSQSSRGTLRPAAEDGVRETGLSVGAHTSSISSLVGPDMMGCRRAGLGFQDSCPGTWGRAASGSVADGGGKPGLKVRREGGKRERDLLAETRLSSPVEAAARSFPYRKYRSHFRLLSFTADPTAGGRGRLPGSGSGGGAREELQGLFRPF